MPTSYPNLGSYFLILFAAFSAWPVAAQTPTVIRLQFIDDSGFPGPVYNPTLGHRVLDPSLRAQWVMQPTSTLKFQIEADLGDPLYTLKLTFRARTSPPACPVSAFEVGTHTVSVRPGQSYSVSIQNIISPNITFDPYQVFYLGVSIDDPAYRVEATCNDTQIGYYCGGENEAFLPLAFYFDQDGSSTAPPADLQPIGDGVTARQFTSGTLDQFNGKTVHGAIENYLYAVKDQVDHPEIGGRRWSLVRIEEGGDQNVLFHGGTLSELDARLDLAAPLDPNPDDHYLIYCQNLDRRGIPADSFDAAAPGSSVFVCMVGQPGRFV